MPRTWSTLSDACELLEGETKRILHNRGEGGGEGEFENFEGPPFLLAGLSNKKPFSRWNRSLSFCKNWELGALAKW